MPNPTEDILDAAATALARDRSASLHHIAKAAGVSRTTLSRHFPTREALIAALVDRVFGETLLALDAAGLDTQPVDSALQSLVGSFGIIGRAWGIGYGLGYSWNELSKLVPGMAERVDTIESRLKVFFERGQREGFFRQDLPAAWLAGALQGLAETTSDLIADEAMGTRQGPDFLAKMFLYGSHSPASR
ncbi:TetR/AcrR family transcriptional regulator [Burkholderia ubonensis]|uniref:TetR/AcrR family transcriptional regulator n=1 Tax=Burkholderia ubonensis TaxID=101571 RepID=UPI0009B3664E|nr:TetR/AcrR family transcriptional regulator [Burkholderia ubonensis]